MKYYSMCCYYRSGMYQEASKGKKQNKTKQNKTKTKRNETKKNNNKQTSKQTKNKNKKPKKKINKQTNKQIYDIISIIISNNEVMKIIIIGYILSQCRI